MDQHELYARTYSATTRHILHPTKEGKTLCGQTVALPELYVGDNGEYRIAGASHLYDLPGCRNCDKSSAKLGLVADRRIRSVKSSELQAYMEDAERNATAVVVVEQGSRVRNAEGVLGKVLEIGQRAGVAVVAVAFGMSLVWVRMAELVVT